MAARLDIRRCLFPAVLALCSMGRPVLAIAQPRIGDPGSVYDPSKDDPAYPNMKEWASAGVEGGIPPRASTPVRVTVQPGEDVQAAIDAATAPGVVLLAAGVHPIVHLELKSGIILRGADKQSTVLQIQQDGTDFIRLNGTERSALEDLTIRHKLVEPIDPAAYYCQYENGQAAIEALTPLRPNQQNTIKLSKVKNCWIQNCVVEKNISRVLRIDSQSSHVTLRDNVWDTALYKGGGGQAYYELVDETSYVLLYNETLKDIRHLALDYGVHHNVVIYSTLQVDVNFHVGPPEHDNLIESLDSSGVPSCHFWGAFSHYKDAAGDGNLIYHAKPSFDDGQVHVFFWPGLAMDTGKPLVQLLNMAPPKSATLYPVTGVNLPPSDAPGGGGGSLGGVAGMGGSAAINGAGTSGNIAAGSANAGSANVAAGGNTSSSAGASTSNSGNQMAGGVAGAVPPTGADAGCSCRVTPAGSSSWGALLATLACAGLRRRRPGIRSNDSWKPRRQPRVRARSASSPAST